MDAICFVWLIWRKWRSASLSKPRAILNVEKTIVFTGSLNIASSLTDINQRYLMQWCTIWRCSHSANIRLDIFKWGPLASDTLSVSLTNWRENWFYLSPRLNNIYLPLFERREIFIGGYLQTILHPSDPRARIKCDVKHRSIFPCSLRAKQNKNCPPHPSALSFHLAFHRFT